MLIVAVAVTMDAHFCAIFKLRNLLTNGLLHCVLFYISLNLSVA